MSAKLHCGDCQKCPAHRQGICSGCPGCGRLQIECRPGRQCDRCRYVCPDWHGDGVWAHTHTNLDGLTFPVGIAVHSPDLPSHVPMISSPLHESPPEGLLPWAALHTGKVGLKIWENGGIRGHFGLSKDTQIMPDFFVRDNTLRHFWERRERWYAVLAAERAAAFAPNFSVYEDAPRIEHLISMKMSAATVAEMSGRSIPVVPDVSWYEMQDLERWAAFIEASGAGAAAFSFQVVGLPRKGDSVWKEYLAGFRFFCSLIPEGVRVVVVGANSPGKIREIVAAARGRPLTFLDTTSFVAARKGGSLISAGGGERAAKAEILSLSLDQIFFENVRRYRRLIKEVSRES